MQLRFSFLLPVILILSGCSEEIRAEDEAVIPDGEIVADTANEVPEIAGETDAPHIELREPVGLD